MPLRLMKIIVPLDEQILVGELLKTADALNIWKEKTADGWLVIRILLHKDRIETISDRFRDHFSSTSGFRIILFPVEAILPEIQQEESSAQAQKNRSKYERISREELYNDIAEGAKLSKSYILTVILSSVVAAVGLMRGDVAIIIGAMVIAPFLTPNVALALAATLGDLRLALQAFKALGAGVGIAVIFSQIIGLTFHIDPFTPEIMSRTTIRLGDIVLGLASGSAGALAFTTGVSSSLTGVMVAVALLPPLVTSGMLAGSGNIFMAFGAFLLFIANVTCINLAGVVTFLAQGVRPRTRGEYKKARRTVRIAVSFWMSVIFILLIVILLSFQH